MWGVTDNRRCMQVQATVQEQLQAHCNIAARTDLFMYHTKLWAYAVLICLEELIDPLQPAATAELQCTHAKISRGYRRQVCRIC